MYYLFLLSAAILACVYPENLGTIQPLHQAGDHFVSSNLVSKGDSILHHQSSMDTVLPSLNIFRQSKMIEESKPLATGNSVVMPSWKEQFSDESVGMISFDHSINCSLPQERAGMGRGGYVVTCDYCDQSFVRLYNLKVHMRRKHGIGQMPRCSVCGARFRSNIGLQKHSMTCR